MKKKFTIILAVLATVGTGVVILVSFRKDPEIREYLSLQTRMESEFGYQIQVNSNATTGGVQIWKQGSVETANAMEKIFIRLAQQNKLASVGVYTSGEFMAFGKALETLRKAHIGVFFKPDRYLTGYLPGDNLHVAKADEDRANALLKK